MKTNVAFTLAEVLITLGIIGVVAAMTLPALLNSTQHKELQTGLQKAYSVIQQAIQRMSYEEGLDITWDNYPNNTFAPVFKKYIQQFSSCGQNGCITADISPEEGDIFSRVSKYKTYNKKQNVTLEWFDEGQAILTDGMFLMINNSSNRNYGIVISVDVNGYGKGPNAWGHDLFSFYINKQKVIPIGAPETPLMPDSAWNSFDCDYAWQRIFEFKQKSLTPEGLLKEGIKICRSIKKLDRVHYMNLVSEAFELIQKGEKTVEIRLNDEKRSQIKIGDQIVFTNLKTKEMIETYVRDLKVYNDFYELYESYDKKSLGYKKNEKADPEDMFKYYTKEKIAKYGALAISLERVQNKKLNLTN